MELIKKEDVTALNLELFRGKYYFHLSWQEGDAQVSIEAQSGEDKREEACEKIRDYYMERGSWTIFSEDLKQFSLESMESEFEY